MFAFSFSHPFPAILSARLFLSPFATPNSMTSFTGIHGELNWTVCLERTIRKVTPSPWCCVPQLRDKGTPVWHGGLRPIADSTHLQSESLHSQYYVTSFSNLSLFNWLSPASLFWIREIVIHIVAKHFVWSSTNQMHCMSTRPDFGIADVILGLFNWPK